MSTRHRPERYVPRVSAERHETTIAARLFNFCRETTRSRAPDLSTRGAAAGGGGREEEEEGARCPRAEMPLAGPRREEGNGRGGARERVGSSLIIPVLFMNTQYPLLNRKLKLKNRSAIYRSTSRDLILTSLARLVMTFIMTPAESSRKIGAHACTHVRTCTRSMARIGNDGTDREQMNDPHLEPTLIKLEKVHGGA